MLPEKFLQLNSLKPQSLQPVINGRTIQTEFAAKLAIKRNVIIQGYTGLSRKDLNRFLRDKTRAAAERAEKFFQK